MLITEYNHNIPRNYRIPGPIATATAAAVAHAAANGSKATAYRAAIMAALEACGWRGPVSVDPSAGGSAITITAQQEAIGLCVQTGNMSRCYADLLKLQQMHCAARISAGIYILPTDMLARRLGDNIAAFGRFTKELRLFSPVIVVPIWVIGFA